MAYAHSYLLALLLSILDPIPAPKARPIATQAPLLKTIPRIPPIATPMAIPKLRYFLFFIFSNWLDQNINFLPLEVNNAVKGILFIVFNPPY